MLVPYSTSKTYILCMSNKASSDIGCVLLEQLRAIEQSDVHSSQWSDKATEPAHG